MLSSARPRRAVGGGFTLIELLTVITIIVILVGLTVGVAGYAQNKARRSRAEAEIKALSAALESYKTDNGVYPRDVQSDPASSVTDSLDARKKGDPSAYRAASKFLYAQLTGQDAAAPAYPPKPAAGARVYFEFKPTMLGAVDLNSRRSSGFQVTAITDPWTASYGYSTAYQADLEATPPVNPPARGYNPTFDLWSVANKPTSTADTTAQQALWLTNW